MKANYLIYLLMYSVLAADICSAKPPPKPAGDLECEECVGTNDIEDGAITTQKFSTDVQDAINQLKTRIAELESRPPLQT